MTNYNRYYGRGISGTGILLNTTKQSTIKDDNTYTILNYFQYNDLLDKNDIITNGFIMNADKTDNVYPKNPVNWCEGLQGSISSVNSMAYSQYNLNKGDSAFDALNGKVIYDQKTGNYYTININSAGESKVTIKVDGNLATYISNNIYRSISNGNNDYSTLTITGSNNGNIIMFYKCAVGQMTLAATQPTYSVKCTLNQNRYHLTDNPYDMFCIPYSDTLEIYKNGSAYCVSNKDSALGIAQAIAAECGSATVYDIQLLPYCPVRDYITRVGIVPR